MSTILERQIDKLYEQSNLTDLPTKTDEMKIRLGLLTKEYCILQKVSGKPDRQADFVEFAHLWKKKLGDHKFKRMYAPTNTTEEQQKPQLSATDMRILQLQQKEDEEERLQRQYNEQWQTRE